MGQVYLARTASGRHVVVKVIRPEFTDDPEFRARFAREAEIARRVGGFHTAQVVDADPEDDPPWIATAFVPGPSLEQTVREKDRKSARLNSSHVAISYAVFCLKKQTTK